MVCDECQCRRSPEVSIPETFVQWGLGLTFRRCIRRRVLIFSHFSEERDGIKLLECIARALFENDARPDYVIFTTYHEREDGTTRIGRLHRLRHE